MTAQQCEQQTKQIKQQTIHGMDLFIPLTNQEQNVTFQGICIQCSPLKQHIITKQGGKKKTHLYP
jgi:hypothetical protein